MFLVALRPYPSSPKLVIWKPSQDAPHSAAQAMSSGKQSSRLPSNATDTPAGEEPDNTAMSLHADAGIAPRVTFSSQTFLLLADFLHQGADLDVLLPLLAWRRSRTAAFWETQRDGHEQACRAHGTRGGRACTGDYSESLYSLWRSSEIRFIISLGDAKAVPPVPDF